jgi:hypothetical protein
VNAQDKIVLKSGKKLDCKIVAINPHSVTYKDSATAENMITVPKTDVLMAEYKSGSVYIFGTDEAPKPVSTFLDPTTDRKKAWKEKEAKFSNNIIGFQPIDLAFGRLTLTYERLILDKQVGIVIPFSMTYDPKVLMFSSADTSNGVRVNRNVSFITGVDVNYYFELRGRTKFFVGPRFRYGTDVLLGNITAYSFQFQNGYFFPSVNGKSANTISIGFGFVRIISVPGVIGGISPKQSYSWASFTYRLGFRLKNR